MRCLCSFFLSSVPLALLYLDIQELGRMIFILMSENYTNIIPEKVLKGRTYVSDIYRTVIQLYIETYCKDYGLVIGALAW